MASNALKYRIEVLDKASKELREIAKEMGILDTKAKKAKPSMNDMAGSLMKFAKGGVITAAVIGGIRAIRRTFINLTNAYKIQEQAEARLDGALQATGLSVQGSLSGLTELASKLQSVTLYGDETTIAAESLLVSIGGLDKDGVSKILPGVMDLATAMGMDLNSAASLVAKSVNSSMNALSRYGIQIDTSGTKSEKLSELTEVLSNKFGGMAKAAANTSTGAIEQLSMAYGDLKEQMGRTVAEGFKPVGHWLTTIIEKMAKAAKKANDYKDALDRIKNGKGTVQDELTVDLKKMSDLQTKKETLAAKERMASSGETGGYVVFSDANKASLAKVDAEIFDLGKRIESLNMTIEGRRQIEEASTKTEKKIAEAKKEEADKNKEFIDQWQDILKIQKDLRSPLKKEADALLEQIDKIQLVWAKGSKYEQARVELLKKLNGKYEDVLNKIRTVALRSATFSVNEDAHKKASLGSMTPEQYDANVKTKKDIGPKEDTENNKSGAKGDSGSDIMGVLSSVGEALSMALPVVMKIVSMSKDYQEILNTVTETLGKLVTDALAPIFEVLNNLLKPVFQILGNIIHSLNPVMLVIANVFKVVGDLLLAVLPSLGMLIQLIGNQLAPILRLLVPIISIFATIMEIINPILEAFGIIMDVMSRPIQYVGDLLAWLGSWLAYFGKALAAVIYNIFHPFKSPKSAGSSPGGFSSDAFTRALIDFSNYTSNTDWANSPTDSNGDGGGGGANYTAGREITVNVQITTEVIAGDAGMRDLSLMIRDEIYAAEALGY